MAAGWRTESVLPAPRRSAGFRCCGVIRGSRQPPGSASRVRAKCFRKAMNRTQSIAPPLTLKRRSPRRETALIRFTPKRPPLSRATGISPTEPGSCPGVRPSQSATNNGRLDPRRAQLPRTPRASLLTSIHPSLRPKTTRPVESGALRNPEDPSKLVNGFLPVHDPLDDVAVPRWRLNSARCLSTRAGYFCRR